METILANLKQALAELESSRSRYLSPESNYAIYKLDGALGELREAARLMEWEVRRRTAERSPRVALAAP